MTKNNTPLLLKVWLKSPLDFCPPLSNAIAFRAEGPGTLSIFFFPIFRQYFMSIKPTLTGKDLTMIVVSFVIGVGIFRTPAIVAQKAYSPEIFFAAWILGGIIS